MQAVRLMTLEVPPKPLAQLERFYDYRPARTSRQHKRRKPRRYSPPPSKKSSRSCSSSHEKSERRRGQHEEEDGPLGAAAAATAADRSDAPDPDIYTIIRIRRVTFSEPEEWQHFSLPRLSFIELVGDPRCDLHGDDPNYCLIAEARTNRLEGFADDHILRKLFHGWRDGVGRCQGDEEIGPQHGEREAAAAA